MPSGLSVALALAAQAAAGPVQPQPQAAEAPKVAASAPADGCVAPLPDATTREIVICAQRPQGYRIDPAIMEAKRRVHNGGRLRPPETMRDTSCQVVGPANCIGAGAGINVIGAAMVLGEMAARVAKGQEIGSIFKTTPTPTEYELYVQAKRHGEAVAREKVAAAKVKAATVKAAPEPAASATQQP